WYISDQKTTTTGNGDSCENSYYKLKSNGTIEYRYMASSYYCEHDTEMGTWSIQGNTLTRHFPSDPGTENEITMKDEVISVSATELKLKNLDNGRTNTLYNFD
ncbi:MAG TPA: lipocalin family protein, partial [Flavobacterium sp.]|nr:lipocalin family protein [Flavobacterium sp.]